jgi:acetylornithine deacetylase/succinyl-diaminopimelate desuccinylase-like protein
VPPSLLMSDAVAEATELLQRLIRNACVNDGTPESGQEVRNVDLLRDYLSGPGVDLEVYEPLPGRASLVARIEGSDPRAPRLLLMGHTDVVPVSPQGWHRDPYGGEIVDGVVWGRGAIDMLNLTATMAVALRRLARSGFRPRGTLVYLAVADEEAGGSHGARWLVEHARDAVAADWVVSESAWPPVPTPEGERLLVTVGEKGIFWLRLRVHGTPGHGSRPLGADNALVKAAEVVRRLASHHSDTVLRDDWAAVWRRWLEGMGYPPDVVALLTDPNRVDEGIARLDPGMAATAHACTHMTIAPTVARGGVKTNVIPDEVELQVDIRLLPGQTPEGAIAELREALGDLADDVDIEVIDRTVPTVSPTDTPLWEALVRAARALRPQATLIPALTTGGTDARFFRELGIPAYGFGLCTPRFTLGEYAAMFHGNDERIDQESLGLSVELWEHLARDLLGTAPAR